jgi:hypothetical protein
VHLRIEIKSPDETDCRLRQALERGKKQKTAPRRLSEKASVEQPIVAVGSMKGDNRASLLLRLSSNRHVESNDE